MNKLFSPATALMNKLNYAQKFIVLGLIYFVAVTVIMYSLYAHLGQVIANSRQQLQGLALIKPISHTIQLMQEHRGLEQGLLSGNEAMRDAHNAKESEADAALLELNQQWLVNFSSDQDWQRFQTDWQTLRAKEHGLDVAVNFAEHTALIEQLQQFKVNVADHYALTFDSEIAAYYLIDTIINKLPTALERLGQMRAFGTSILVKKQMSEDQKIRLFTLIAEFNSAFKSLNINLEKTSRYNSAIKANLSTATKDIELSAQQIIELVQSDILSRQFATTPEAYFNTATMAMNKGYEQMLQSLLPSIELLLKARIEQAEKELLINLGIVLMTLLAVIYIFAAIYYVTVNSVQSLARSAQKFAQGDFSERIKLNTRDELNQIAQSFNEMADGFNTLLETHNDSEERLRTIINSALDAIIQMDANGCITGWNKRAEVMFGWTSAEVLGHELDTIIMPLRYREAHVRGYQNFLKTGKGKIFDSLIELEGLHREGHEFPVELSVSPVRTVRGIEFSAFIRDISNRKSTEETLRLLSLATEQSPNSIVITDLDANIQFANKAFSTVTGYSLEEAIGQNPRILHSGKTSQAIYDELWTTLLSGDVWQGELINHRKDGSEYTELAVISPVRQANGQITHYLAVKQDITEKKHAETELRIAAVAFESQEGILVSDANNVILRVNQAFAKITGYSTEEVIGRTPALFSSGRQNSAFYAELWHSIQTTGTWHGEIWNRHKNGTEYLAWITITAVHNVKAEITHYVETLTDMTERKLAEEKIKQLAFYDPLTELPNRRTLLDRLEFGIAMNERNGIQLAILMMDLDYFKIVNDTLGHLAGDDLLKQVAKRISANLRHTDMVARLGGDEFVILLEDIKREEDVARVASNIIADLSTPFLLAEKQEVRIGASIGISLCPLHGNTALSLIDHADSALYQAKKQGRGCFAYFSENLTRVVREQLEIELRLRQSISNQELQIYYQPQVDIRTGKIIGAEALVRWQDPHHGFTIPSRFIPIAEENSLIIAINEWVLRETCRQGRQWLDAGLLLDSLSVNVSPLQIRRSDITSVVVAILTETGFPAERLILEITEVGLMEHQDAVVGIFNDLRKIGVRLTIDNFGIGYSSLAYLKRFPLDTMNIDRSFVDDLFAQQNSGDIVASIINMGHSLGFKVLAEGVETPEQLDFLQQQGCDAYQGYFKSPPIPPENFACLLRGDSSAA